MFRSEPPDAVDPSDPEEPEDQGDPGAGAPDLPPLLERVVDWHGDWQARFGAVPADPALATPDGETLAVLDELTDRLEENFPTFHPSYAGHMAQPPHPVAMAAYLATMMINPNAVNWDSGPATVRMEHEVVDQLAAMIGFEGHYLGHLTTGGTAANLEALYVARERRPELAVAFSDQAHYTHARVCRTLGVEGVVIPSDDRGRMDVGALRARLAEGRIGTVVATAGTTGLGAVDPVDEIVVAAREHGALVHVDAAYGGYFALLPRSPFPTSRLVDPAPWTALAAADSVVVDPHKHGLQPYGCGSVVYRDASAREFLTDYNSPYLDFESPRVALGQASLECSRAGAATAALWATTRLFPLEPGGRFVEALAASRRAALRWTARVESSAVFRSYQPPDLDIVTYFDGRLRRTSTISAASDRLLVRGRDAENPVHVTQLTVPASQFHTRHPDVLVDSDHVRLLRSVLIKPTHEAWVDRLVTRLEDLAGHRSRSRRPPDAPDPAAAIPLHRSTGSLS